MVNSQGGLASVVITGQWRPLPQIRGVSATQAHAPSSCATRRAGGFRKSGSGATLSLTKCRIYRSFRGRRDNLPQTQCLRQQKKVVASSRRLEVRSQNVSGSVLPLKPERKNPSWPLLGVAIDPWHSLSRSYSSSISVLLPVPRLSKCPSS